MVAQLTPDQKVVGSNPIRVSLDSCFDQIVRTSFYFVKLFIIRALDLSTVPVSGDR